MKNEIYTYIDNIYTYTDNKNNGLSCTAMDYISYITVDSMTLHFKVQKLEVSLLSNGFLIFLFEIFTKYQISNSEKSLQ